jgi:hypothetical protein
VPKEDAFGFFFSASQRLESSSLVDSWLYRENLRDETYRASKQACVSFDAVSATKARQKSLSRELTRDRLHESEHCFFPASCGAKLEIFSCSCFCWDLNVEFFLGARPPSSSTAAAAGDDTLAM